MVEIFYWKEKKMANEWKVEKQKKEKRKKLLIKLGITLLGILIFIAYGFYDKYNYGKPSQLFDSHLNKMGEIEEFEFSISGNRGWHYIGISVSEKFLLTLDGNYTVEYYKSNKFLKKEIINKDTVTYYYENKPLMMTGGGHWVTMPLGRIEEDGDYRIVITVHDVEKPLKNYNGKVYFFVNRPSKFLRIEDTMTKESMAKDKRIRLFQKKLYTLIDKNETNKTLIPLRKALDSNNLEKVKKILEADNNISVNTNMLLGRRVLDYASFQNNEKLVQYLIDKGAEIHHKDELGANALTYAIENNSTKTAKSLIDSGIDVNEVVFVHNYLQNRINGKYYPKTMILSPLAYTSGNALFEMTELLLKGNIIDRDVSSYEDKIWVEENAEKNIDVFFYLYQNESRSEDTITKKEREIILKIFKKYNFKINKPKSNFSNQIGH